MSAAEAFPADDIPPGLGSHIVTQVLIRHKKNWPVLRQGGHHLHGIGRGAGNIAFGFDFCGSIDITDNGGARQLLLLFAQLRRSDHIGHGAAGVYFRQEHRLLRGQDEGALRHKVDTAKNYYFSIAARCLPGEAQGVAHIIGNFLNLRRLVGMSQDHGMAFFLQSPDFAGQILCPGLIRHLCFQPFPSPDNNFTAGTCCTNL